MANVPVSIEASVHPQVQTAGLLPASLPLHRNIKACQFRGFLPMYAKRLVSRLNLLTLLCQFTGRTRCAAVRLLGVIVLLT